MKPHHTMRGAVWGVKTLNIRYYLLIIMLKYNILRIGVTFFDKKSSY